MLDDSMQIDHRGHYDIRRERASTTRLQTGKHKLKTRFILTPKRFSGNQFGVWMSGLPQYSGDGVSSSSSWSGRVLAYF